MKLTTTIDRDAARALGPLPAGHPRIRAGKIGVLLVNLGTPDGTSFWPMWRYLREFLSDRRVIETSRLVWYPILYGIVLTRRPSRSGANYDRIWNREKNESPLLTVTRSQADRLSAALAGEPRLVVDYAMRYGNPSIPSAVARLKEQGCDRLVVFPLYPQYAAATTATVYDKLFDTLKTMRDMPTIRGVPPYHDEPAYIEALARSVERHLAGLDHEPEVVVASYHGIPQSYFDDGDPYHCHCQKTTRLLRERLGWDKDRLITTFQSRFGRAEWIKPYTDETVEKLAHDGVRKIAVVNPGFSTDCLETIDEIDREVRETFMHAGGTHFSHIRCLNDGDDGMALIEELVRRELSGWI